MSARMVFKVKYYEVIPMYEFNELDLLMDRFGELAALLKDYDGLTAALLSADLEKITEADDIIIKRQNIINRMNALRPEITALIDRQPQNTAAAIRGMMADKLIRKPNTAQNKEEVLQEKIYGLHALQSGIIQKELESTNRFTVKREEIRSILAELQKDKKKINFYSTSAHNIRGKEFDTIN